jgi:hypothetical protein
MKTATYTLAALLALAFMPAPTSQATAAEKTGAAQAQQQQPQDISAARKKKKKHYYSYRRGPAYAYGWRPADPTPGPHSLYNYYRRNNICAIDEGYGRATRCD